ncbi:DUF1761 domain-containing protein [Nitriliruptoria bacterium AS10]|nr:DUF1761 domain-containing protein [Salsipaludibacter albus]
MSPLAIAVATIVGVVISGTYYAVVTLPEPADGVRQPPTAAVQGAVELGRSAATALLVAWLAGEAGRASLVDGAVLGAALWVLPVVLLVGSVVHEGTPVRAAVVHAGDWLLKLVAVGAVVASLAR